MIYLERLYGVVKELYWRGFVKNPMVNVSIVDIKVFQLNNASCVSAIAKIKYAINS
jgi:hypothetical protein